MAKKAKRGKRTKRVKDFIGLFAKLDRAYPELHGLPIELRRMIEKWHTVPLFIQNAVLDLCRVRRPSSAKGNVWRRKKGEEPEWFPDVLQILKESRGYLTDTEIARRVGLNPSTLCRCEAYQNAKKTYLQPFLTPGRRGLRREPQQEDEL